MGMFQSENGYIEKYFTVGDKVIVELLIDELNGMCIIYDVTEDEILHQKYEPRNEFEVNITLPLMKCVGEDDNTLVFTTNALALLTKKILRAKYGNEIPISMHSTGYEAVDKLIANKGDTNKAKNKNKDGATLNDVILDDDTKRSILRVINFVAKKPLYEAIGAKLSRGILLWGNPGVGKTRIGQVIAQETGYNIVIRSASSLLGQYVGSSAKNVRDLFAEQKQKGGNSIIFLDEIDAIAMKRDDNDSSKEYRSIICELLSILSNPEYDDILVICTCNRPEDLDEGFIREGRMDMKIHIKDPDEEQLKKIFDLYISKVKHEDDIDSELLAKECVGKNGSFVQSLINNSAIRAVDEGCTEVSMQHILDEMKFMMDNNLEIKDKDTFKPINKIGF